jgi:phage gpG-like protein
MQNLIQNLQKLQNFLSKDVYDIVGGEAEDFYKQSFENEGFTDRNYVRWQDVKRRTNPRPSQKGKASANLPILTNSGDLHDSIHYEAVPDGVKIHASGKGDDGGKIAKVHNEGGKAGRKGHEFDMPQRQFIGPSETLNRQLNYKVKTKIKTILNTP